MCNLHNTQMCAKRVKFDLELFVKEKCQNLGGVIVLYVIPKYSRIGAQIHSSTNFKEFS